MERKIRYLRSKRVMYSAISHIKVLKSSFLVSLFLITAVASGQIMSDVERSLEAGQTTGIIKHLDFKISLTLNNRTEMLKADAVKEKLKQFFLENKPTSYSRKHSGRDKSGTSEYIIGQLRTSNADYRVYVYVEKIKGEKRIIELRFEPL